MSILVKYRSHPAYTGWEGVLKYIEKKGIDEKFCRWRENRELKKSDLLKYDYQSYESARYVY